MTHLSEAAKRLSITRINAANKDMVMSQVKGLSDVSMIILPPRLSNQSRNYLIIRQLIKEMAQNLGPEATFITIGEDVDLVHVHEVLASCIEYQLWVSIKRANPLIAEDNTKLPQYHFGALVHTRYKGSLRHTKTRIGYTYCPACDRTTKDYGGKKHTYNSYGTLISDVWRDISADLEGDLSSVIERFADLFGITSYEELRVFDFRTFKQGKQQVTTQQISDKPATYTAQPTLFHTSTQGKTNNSRLICGDSLEILKTLSNDSVDFAFADPPYNLNKKYNSYSDDLSIKEYFEWCDAWISELARVLRPGRTCAILNIPLWSIRHFLHLETILTFQNWIAWDALSFPVRKIMPAHYAILCFSKGPSRPLPGLTGHTGPFQIPNASKTFHPLEPLAEWFCLRSKCVRVRQATQQNDRGPLTNLWWDIHRLKHNSRRVDHPCQLPPQLMYRLISIFTKPGEIVLDCFNGAGTTTLTAHQLDRQYIGIEISEKYHDITKSRHAEILQGIDPFRKADRKLTEKNSPVERMPKQVYEVPKKTLQLEVRRVARELDRLPTREEMIKYGKYPIKYYDEYFISWGEVCAAARHDGMSENRTSESNDKPESRQLSLFE